MALYKVTTNTAQLRHIEGSFRDGTRWKGIESEEAVILGKSGDLGEKQRELGRCKEESRGFYGEVDEGI